MSKNSVGSEKPCVIYFQPGQIMFHAHGNLNSTPGAVKKLIEWAGDIATRKKTGISISKVTKNNVYDFNPNKLPAIYPKPTTVARASKGRPRFKSDNDSSIQELEKSVPKSGLSYTSPAVQIPPPFSLIFATVASNRWQVKKGINIEKQLAEASKELLDLIIELDERRATAPVKLEVISPNWLISGGPEPGGTGGPGGKPSPVQDTDIDKYHIKLAPYQVSVLPQAFADVSQPGGGDGVVVAILDTAYPEKQKKQIYAEWAKPRSNGQGHPIIENLFKKNGRLTIHEDPTVDTYLPGITILGHDYDMTDHGLFIAGIVNSIAPQADIHLYQVLNKYGLGDLQSIARALQDIAKNFSNRPLVVNLSLTMNFPLEDKHLHPNDYYGLGQAILRQQPWRLAKLVARLFNWIVGKPMLCTCDSWFDRQARSFEWICDLIYNFQSRVIAAAGNNAQQGHGRPMALYPAAFERVFGVGALAKNIPPNGQRVRNANYSNLADRPPRKGITTLGGEQGAGNGVLGVYIGKFPNDKLGRIQKNDNGWAWWCGTSFATPIISGITAVALSKLKSANPGSSTEAAIMELYNAELRKTIYGEDVLGVEQS